MYKRQAQAERWEILDGGKRYIFHLRSGLQWSDGQPLTAEDFVLGWQRAVDPKTASPFAGYLAQAHINNAAAIVAGKADVTSLGVKATDDRTLEVTLEQPVPWFTTMLAWPTLFPVPHHVIAKHGDVYKRQDQHSLRNAGELDTVLAKFPHVKYLLCGHIHQELDLDWNGRRLLATPSTCCLLYTSRCV